MEFLEPLQTFPFHSLDIARSKPLFPTPSNGIPDLVTIIIFRERLFEHAKKRIHTLQRAHTYINRQLPSGKSRSAMKTRYPWKGRDRDDVCHYPDRYNNDNYSACLGRLLFLITWWGRLWRRGRCETNTRRGSKTTGSKQCRRHRSLIAFAFPGSYWEGKTLRVNFLARKFNVTPWILHLDIFKYFLVKSAKIKPRTY